MKASRKAYSSVATSTTTNHKPGMWKRLFFNSFRFHIYRFRFHRFRFHQQKTKKRPLTIFFYFCGSVACLLLHFIILRRQKPSFIAITLPTSLELLFRTTLCLFFLDIRTRVECRTVLFNLFDIAKSLMYFRVCHGTPTNKNLEITNYCKKIKYFVTKIQKIIKHFNKQTVITSSFTTYNYFYNS